MAETKFYTSSLLWLAGHTDARLRRDIITSYVRDATYYRTPGGISSRSKPRLNLGMYTETSIDRGPWHCRAAALVLQAAEGRVGRVCAGRLEQLDVDLAAARLEGRGRVPLAVRGVPGLGVGFGHIVVSEKEVPIILANLV